MKRMKRGLAFLTAAFLMVSSISVNVNAATSTGKELKLETTLVNIQVKDEAENPVSGSSFTLSDSKGQVVASWTSGKENEAVCKNGVQVAKSTDTNDYIVNAEDLLGKSIQGVGEIEYLKEAPNIYMVVVNGKKPKDEVKSGTASLGYGKPYKFNVTYYDKQSTDLTVPGNKVGIIDQSEKSDGVFWKLGGTTSLDAHYNPSGTPTYTGMSAGDYSFWFGLKIGAGESGVSFGDTLTVSNQETKYFKKTINLGKEFPDLFNEKGEMLPSSNFPPEYGNYLGGKTALPRGKQDLPDGNYAHWDFCIISGSLIQLPKVDADGNIEIYVQSDTYQYNLYTDYYTWINGSILSGGGKRVQSTCLEEVKNIEAATPQFESNGITFKGLTTGTYTLVQTGCDEAHEKAENQSINVVVV